MKEKFSIPEILQAVNLLSESTIISNKKPIKEKQKVETTINPETEKIILEAEEFLSKNSKKYPKAKFKKESKDIYLLDEEMPYLLNNEVKNKSG